MRTEKHDCKKQTVLTFDLLPARHSSQEQLPPAAENSEILNQILGGIRNWRDQHPEVDPDQMPRCQRLEFIVDYMLKLEVLAGRQGELVRLRERLRRHALDDACHTIVSRRYYRWFESIFDSVFLKHGNPDPQHPARLIRAELRRS